jgi:hypothetical protein
MRRTRRRIKKKKKQRKKRSRMKKEMRNRYVLKKLKLLIALKNQRKLNLLKMMMTLLIC